MAGLTVTERVLLYTTEDCWQEYLRVTRTCGEANYAEIEPWAWARLQRKLKPPKRKETP